MWHVPSDLTRIIDELEKGPDRSAAIVAAAFVESAISDLISDRLTLNESPSQPQPQPQSRVRKELLGVDRPLGSVSSRCKLAFLLGIISEDALNDLLIISEIRNKFAHFPENDSFSIDGIRDKCNNLKIIKQHNRINAAGKTPIIINEGMNTVSLKGGTWSAVRSKDSTPFVSIGIDDKDEKLKLPRGKYLISVRILLAAFDYYKTSHIRDKQKENLSTII